MDDKEKGRDELLNELQELRREVSVLKARESQSKVSEVKIRDTLFGADVQKIIDSLPFYVLLVDDKHNILLANKAVKQKLDKDPNEIIGGYCPRVIHGTDKPIANCPLEEAVEKGHGVEREYFDHDYQIWVKSAIYPSECKTEDGSTVYFHMVQDITERKLSEGKLYESFNKLRKMSQSIINAITITVERRDPYTAGHQQRVSRMAVSIAKEMGIPDEQVEGIRISGLVHDIGKITVPIEILSKPGNINIHEFNIIKSHSEVGYDILKGIEFPWPIAQTILQHHERLDGSGYPNGLKDKDIILEARILSVADVVEAMASHRPYRQSRGLDAAINEISSGKGILYDAEIVEACISVIKKGFSLE